MNTAPAKTLPDIRTIGLLFSALVLISSRNFSMSVPRENAASIDFANLLNEYFSSSTYASLIICSSSKICFKTLTNLKSTL